MSARPPAIANHRRPLDRRLSLRWSVDLVVKFREHRSCTLPLKMLDLSVSGCRVKTDFRLRNQEDTVIVIPGFAPLAVHIVWSLDGQTGLRFAAPLHPAVAEHIYRLGNGEEPLAAHRSKSLS